MFNRHGDLIPKSHLKQNPEELCPRCYTGKLTWLFSSLFCKQCHWKEGCCNGE